MATNSQFEKVLLKLLLALGAFAVSEDPFR
jgi:hypothetical protein